MATLLDRLRNLSPGQQIALVVAAVAATSCVLLLVWFLFFRVTYQVLFTQLRPSDAASIIGDLERKKVSYELADGGATILVPADIADRTRLSVMTEDVPLKGTVGFELFDKSDMGLTDFAQKINYQRALQGELERTIATLDGVDSARVHLSLGEDRIFRDDRVPPTASVTIRMQKGATLAANAAQGIQRLIAAAVPNLEVANVVILDEKGRVVGTSPPPRRSEATSPLEQENRAIEQYYEAKVRLALERAYPLGVVAVVVSADAASDGADWNPSSRSFPLKVSLSSSSPLDESAQTAIRALVASAVGFDPTKNDAIEFGVADVEPTPVRIVHSPVASSVTAEALTPPNDHAQSLATIAIFLALVGAIGAVLWTIVRPRRISDAQRARLAAKFRAALGDSHVAP